MTRLTDEQIDREWDATDNPYRVRQFASRIAALAVQEVERERDYWRTDAEDKSDAVATLTAQLAEARDEIAGFEAMWEQREKAHDAEVAEAKRDAFKSGMVYGINAGPDVTIGDMLDKVDAQYPATPSGEGHRCKPEDGCEVCDILRPATPSPEAREVTSEMVDVGVEAMAKAMNERGPIASHYAVRAILTAALSAGGK